jgi:hypothetical protein
MKKLVSVLFAALLVGSFAFAEVTTGAWGRFTFVPAASIDGEDQFAFSSPTWAAGSRIGVSFAGTSDNVGFNINLDGNGPDNFGIGDQAKVWIKFNDMIALQGGKIQQDVLRGKIGDSNVLGSTGIDGAWVPAGTSGKNDIFKRFEPKSGIVLDITPAEGVYIGAALDTAGQAVPPTMTEDMLKTIQIGAGYVIADMGHARVQYIGGLDDAAAWLQAAFAYTAMEGLVVDAGLKYNIGEADTAQSTFTVHATYAMDALSLLGRVKVRFGEDAAGDELGYNVSADVAYQAADPLAIGIEVAYEKRDDPYEMSFLPYAKLGYGQGFLKAGFLYNSKDDGVDTIGSWALPIVMEYWF